MMDDVEFSDFEFQLLRDFIHERTGLYFKRDKKSFLKMKLAPRLPALGLSSFTAYLQTLRYGVEARRELMKIFSLITNNETYFFRELPQLQVFRDRVLPALRKEKYDAGRRSVRILSAGCSTGEEVYTLAMIAFETGSFFWDWDFKIIGMDANERVLENARRGVYLDRAFRMSEPHYMNKFFNPNSGAHFTVKDNIRRMVEFTIGNICDPASYQDLPPLDVIVCRNVIIYFSEEKIKETIDNFHRSLVPGGRLLLGHSESLAGINEDFETLRFPETLIYRKRME